MMPSQHGDIGAGSRRSSGPTGPHGSQEHGQRGGKFEKRAHSKRRVRNPFNKDHHVSTDSSANQSNNRNNTSSTAQAVSFDSSTIPTWFKPCMEEFKRELVAELTENIIKHIDATRDDDAARRRHKSNYFSLKKRCAELEQQLDEERGKSNNNGDNNQSTSDHHKHTAHGYERKNNRFDYSNNSKSNYRKTHDDNNNQSKTLGQDDKVSSRVTDSPVSDSNTSDDGGNSVIQVIHNDDNKNNNNNDSESSIKSEETIKVDVHNDAEVTQKNNVDDDDDDKKVNNNEKIIEKSVENKSDFTDKINDILKNPVSNENYKNNVTKHIDVLNDNMTDDNIKKLIEILFDKVQELPDLAEFYGNLISKIINQHPNYIKAQKILTDVGQQQLDKSNYEKVLLICALYEQRLLNYEFMSSCIMKFMKFENDTDKECFVELLEAVGENLGFWKSTKLLVMLQDIIEKDKYQDEKIIQPIVRIFQSVNTSMSDE